MSEMEQSIREKSAWVEAHLKKYGPNSVIFDINKEKYARQGDGTPNILIDDFETNIRLWEANGGIGIHYTDGQADEALQKLRHALKGKVSASEPLQLTMDEDLGNRANGKLYTNKQVLKYVKGIHNEYHLEKPILKHKVWKLADVPLANLKNPEFYDQDDPYRRVIDLDWDHIDNITIQDIARKPIVADSAGWVLDGNHRLTAARAIGLRTIQALVPYEKS